MTAIQIVNEALEANKDTSLYTMLRLQKQLNQIADCITGEMITEGWRRGRENIENLIANTDRMAVSGEVFRII